MPNAEIKKWGVKDLPSSGDLSLIFVCDIVLFLFVF